jgi:holo-[acyl-carrier protein] synthase
MKIVGHGIDVVQITELEQLLKLSETAFTSRSFSDREIAMFPEGHRRLEHIAGRFAAKEAVLKALGTGFGNGTAFTDIEIERTPGSPPQILVSGGVEEKANQRGVCEWWLSISHSGDVVIASVIAVS